MRPILGTFLLMLTTASARAETVHLYAAEDLARYIVAEKAQEILRRHGFGSGDPAR
jgi:hypothetical protein